MANEEAKNCWEYWNCDMEVRKKCPAFLYDSGGECWMVAGHFVESSKQCPRLKKKFCNCFECPWFQKQNPGFSKENI